VHNYIIQYDILCIGMTCGNVVPTYTKRDIRHYIRVRWDGHNIIMRNHLFAHEIRQIRDSHETPDSSIKANVL